MGPGIFTRHAKAVIGGISLVILVFAAAALYGYFRGPVSGASPYETVNDLYDWGYMTFTADRAVYPAETETVELIFYCDLSRFYPSPLEPGQYRIVIPDCEHMRDMADLAVEFEVI